ncbi:MAG: TetR/AcrR family transcriptional regulator [Polyangiaceae bacterium]
MPRTGLPAAEIRRKAIDATMQKMRLEGFDQVRLTEIAKELGVSHAALYQHFEDKAALLDAVSARWLLEIDESLAAICQKPAKDPTEKIQAWLVALHRAKLAKVRHDPELYKSFDSLANAKKPYVQQHMAAMRAQLLGLTQEAVLKRRLRDANPPQMAEIIWESMMAFHHPKLVAQHLDEKREPLLKQVLESVLKGLNLKA